jgi:hypothetical protein
MAVQKSPDELTRHVGNRELKMRVLQRGVMPSLVDGAGQFIPFRAFFPANVLVQSVPRHLGRGHDPFGGITSPGRGHGVVERSLEGIDQLHRGCGREKCWKMSGRFKGHRVIITRRK